MKESENSIVHSVYQRTERFSRDEEVLLTIIESSLQIRRRMFESRFVFLWWITANEKLKAVFPISLIQRSWTWTRRSSEVSSDWFRCVWADWVSSRVEEVKVVLCRVNRFDRKVLWNRRSELKFVEATSRANFSGKWFQSICFLSFRMEIFVCLFLFRFGGKNRWAKRKSEKDFFSLKLLSVVGRRNFVSFLDEF